jgi:TRAP-type uncharacterized transport system substrate-binding protein
MFMTVIYSAVLRLFRRLLAGAGMLALSLLSIHCGDGGPALETINRKSFAPCSEIPHAAGPVKYLATASTGGAYALLGDAIAKVAKGSPDTELKVCTTVGSSENLKLLQQRRVQFALVQLDTLHYAIEAANDGGPALEDISLVTFLYSEKLHLFVKPHLYLNSPADLNHGGGGNGGSRRARVWLGQQGSGARQTASKVLQAAGVADEDLMKFGSNLNDLSWDVAANCLLAEGNTGLAAYFRTMAVPGHAPSSSDERRKRPACPLVEPSARPVPLSVDDLLRADAQIMPLPRELIDRLTEDGLYVRTTIEFGNYAHLRRGVPTVGIPTVLLTNLPSSHRGAVKALIDRIETRKAAIERHIDGVELDQLSRNEPIQGLPVHPGAEDHFRGHPSPLIWFGLFAVGLLAAGWWRDPLAVRRGLAAGSLAWVISASLAAIWVLLSLAMMRAEGRINPSFSTVSESFVNTFGVVTRFRDIPLMTPEGEIWRWLGLLVFPVILGWLFSDVLKDFFRLAAARLARFIQSAQARDAHVLLVAVARRLRRSAEWIAGKPQPRGALVFLNWSSRAEQIAGELQEDPALAGRRIVVVQPGGAQSKVSDRFANATVVAGDPTTRGAMEKAGIHEASAVTIVSNWISADPTDRRRRVDPEYADSKTLLTILAIRALCEDRNRSAVLPIRAEIQLARNQQEALNAIQGGPLTLTVLASDQVSALPNSTSRRLHALSA